MPFLKVSVLHYRDKSRDEGEWMKWYLEEQIPRFVPVAHKHGIDRLELVSFNPSNLDLYTASSTTTNVLGNSTSPLRPSRNNSSLTSTPSRADAPRAGTWRPTMLSSRTG